MDRIRMFATLGSFYTAASERVLSDRWLAQVSGATEEPIDE